MNYLSVIQFPFQSYRSRFLPLLQIMLQHRSVQFQHTSLEPTNYLHHPPPIFLHFFGLVHCIKFGYICMQLIVYTCICTHVFILFFYGFVSFSHFPTAMLVHRPQSVKRYTHAYSYMHFHTYEYSSIFSREHKYQNSMLNHTHTYRKCYTEWYS